MITARELSRNPAFRYFELIAGEPRSLSLPMESKRTACVEAFAMPIMLFAAKSGIGVGFSANTGFLLAQNPDTVKAPDFAFTATKRLPRDRTFGYLAVAPDMVLETATGEDQAITANEKIQEWLAAGTRTALLLNPVTESLTVYRTDADFVRLTRNDSFTAEDILPGFALPLTNVFPTT